MKYQFICYSRWSTCRKARSFLDENNISYDERDIKKDNPREDELRKWLEKSNYPIKRFFNTSGKIYRELGLKNKLDSMSLDEKIELLSTDGMLIKRPILVGEDIIFIGFTEGEWEDILNHNKKAMRG